MPIRKLVGASFAALAFVVLGGRVAAEPIAPDSPAARAHNDAARALAGDVPQLLWPYERFCVTGFRLARSGDAMDKFVKTGDFMTPKGYITMQSIKGHNVEPIQVFDNIYFVGTSFIGSYIVKTSAGIIIIDAMNDGDDVDKVIVPGMKKFNLDPKDIKYIILTHQHDDHFGGINRLLELAPDAKVVAGKPDADALEARRLAGPKPGALGLDGKPISPEAAKRAIALIPSRFDVRMSAAPGSVNGVQDLSLGGTTIRMALVPSHTIGMLSLVIPTAYHGEGHVVAMWGGNHIDAPNLPEKAKQYTASLDYFHSVTALAGADAALHPHAYQDAEADMMETLRANPQGPNPFVLGKDGYNRYISIWTECMRALGQRAEDGTWKRF